MLVYQRVVGNVHIIGTINGVFNIRGNYLPILLGLLLSGTKGLLLQHVRHIGTLEGKAGGMDFNGTPGDLTVCELENLHG